MPGKDNLKKLLEYFTLSIEDSPDIRRYFGNIFLDLTSNKENLTIYSFNHYLRLPFALAKILYNFMRGNDSYLNKETFSEGLSKIFISKTNTAKINFVFQLYDFDNDGVIHKQDIYFFLKYFHSIKNEIDVKKLYELIDFALDGNESLNLNQWITLTKTKNSDIFILTLFYLFINKPFCEENIKFYLNNFCDNKRQLLINECEQTEIEDKSLMYSLYDSSKNLINYINSNFKEQFEYLYFESDDDNSIDSLEDFDDLKSKIMNDKVTETILADTKKKSNNTEEMVGNTPMDFFRIQHQLKDFTDCCETAKNQTPQLQNKTNNIIFSFNAKDFFNKKIGQNLNKNQNNQKKLTVIGTESNIKKEFLEEELEEEDEAKKMAKFESNLGFEIKRDFNKNSFSYFHCLKYEIEAYHDMSNNPFNDSIANLTKYKLIFMNDEIYMTIPNTKEVVKIINLKNSFVTKNKEIEQNGILYYNFQVNSYDLNENEIQKFSTKKSANSSISGFEELPNTIREKLFLIENKRNFERFYNHITSKFHERRLDKNYEITDEIGKGAFGKVFKGFQKNKPSRMNYAIKQITKKDIQLSDLEYLTWELDIFNLLQHQNNEHIIKAIEKYEDLNYMYLIYEYMPDGDLGSYRKHFSLSNTRLKNVCKQLLLGIKFLQEYDIVHRDIKPENILIKRVGVDIYGADVINTKLIDFGLSIILNSYETSSQACGSLVYIAPEVLNKKKYGKKADIWSFGMTMYYLKFGKLPFNGNEEYVTKKYNEIHEHGFHFEGELNRIWFEDIICRIIMKCIQYEPNNRSSVSELLSMLD